MNAIPTANRSFLSIDWNKYREIEHALSDSGKAVENDSNQEIQVVSTLDQLAEIKNAATQMKAAQQKAYDSFRDQFLEINNFIQSSRNSNEKNILHAYYKESIDHSGNRNNAIILYTRPRSSNLFIRFFGWALYSEQEELAQKFLLRFLRSAPTVAPSDPLESQDTKETIDKLPFNALPWINSIKGIGEFSLTKDKLSIVKWSSRHFLEIANQINEQMQTEKENEKAKNVRMFECIAWDDDFFQWKPDYKNPETEKLEDEIPALPEELKWFGPEKIQAFSDFIGEIKKLNFTHASPDRVRKIFDFCTTWVSCFNRKDKQGDVFRNVINGSSQLRAWNVAAHYIALRDHPYVIKKKADPYTLITPLDSEAQQPSAPFNPAMMDFRHYEKKTHIMVPPLNEVYFPQQTDDEQATFHAVGAADKKFRGKNQSIEISGQALTLYKPLKIGEELKLEQEAEIYSVYQEFINTAVKANKKIVLTPIFNYTEHAIDRCIDAIITPIVTQKTVKGGIPEIRFFSSDPRITEKFHLAISDPENYMALRAASKAAKTAMPTAPIYGLDQLQLQCSILSRDMKDPGMIMMHASAGKYGTINGNTAQILDGFTKKPLFARAAAAGTAIPRTRKKTLLADALTPQQPSDTTNRTNTTSVATGEKDVISTTQFIMPTNELHLGQSPFSTLSNLLGYENETLSPEQKDTIRQTYMKVFKNAKEKEISNLVLIPCFDLKQRDPLQEQACAEMLGVVDEFLVSNPGMVVKMALASQDELTFMQQQIVRWKKAGRQSTRKGI